MSILLQQLLHSKDPCAIFSRGMQHSAKILDRQAENSTPPRISLDGVEIRLVRLPLLEPFETSFGKIDSRLIFLICLSAEGLSGWGEVVASEKPLYSYETVGTAFHVIKDFLAPAVLDGPISSLPDLAKRFAPFRGHNMAKAGLELAYMDLLAQAQLRQCFDRRLHDVRVVARAEGFRENVANAGSLDNCTHSPAGNNASSGRSRAKQHSAAAMFADDFVRNRILPDRNLYE